MANKKILVLPGDGIGREVCEATISVLDLLKLPIDLIYGDIGWECWVKEGNPVLQDTWEKIEQVSFHKPLACSLPADHAHYRHRWVFPQMMSGQLRQLASERARLNIGKWALALQSNDWHFILP